MIRTSNVFRDPKPGLSCGYQQPLALQDIAHMEVPAS